MDREPEAVGGAGRADRTPHVEAERLGLGFEGGEELGVGDAGKTVAVAGLTGFEHDGLNPDECAKAQEAEHEGGSGEVVSVEPEDVVCQLDEECGGTPRLHERKRTGERPPLATVHRYGLVVGSQEHRPVGARDRACQRQEHRRIEGDEGSRTPLVSGVWDGWGRVHEGRWKWISPPNPELNSGLAAGRPELGQESSGEGRSRQVVAG